jgi:HEAT repeat protein
MDTRAEEASRAIALNSHATRFISKISNGPARAYAMSRMRLLVMFFATTCLFGQTAGEIAWRVIEHGVSDPNPIKRRQAILAMGSLRPQSRPVALIEGALGDKETSVREAACATLGEIKARTSIPKLQMALADAAPEVIFAAAKALYNMGDATGKQVITAVLLGEQSDASGFLSSSMRSMKLKMHDPKALLMIGVNESAGFAGPFGMGVPLAEGLLKDNQASGKTVAALLLATDTSPETLQALKDGLSEKNWTVRVASARAIGIRQATGLYEDVAKLLDDKRDEVEFSAAATLIRLKQPVERKRQAKPAA